MLLLYTVLQSCSCLPYFAVWMLFMYVPYFFLSFVCFFYCLQFLPRDAMHKRGYSRHAVSVRLSVRYVRGSCQNE